MTKREKSNVSKVKKDIFNYVSSESTMTRGRKYTTKDDAYLRQFRRQSYDTTFPSGIFDEFDNYLKSKKHGNVLDIGAGKGTAMEQLHELYPNIKVEAIDLKAEHNKKVSMIKGDAEHLPYKSKSFDGIVSCIVLPYVPDKLKAIAEMHRVLKKGGKAIITLGNTYERLDKSAPDLYSGDKFVVDEPIDTKPKERFEKDQLRTILKKEKDIVVDGDSILITKNHRRLKFENRYNLQDIIIMKSPDSVEQSYPVYEKIKFRERFKIKAKKTKEKLKNLLCIF